MFLDVFPQTFSLCIFFRLSAYKLVLRDYGLDSSNGSDVEGSDLEVMDVSRETSSSFDNDISLITFSSEFQDAAELADNNQMSNTLNSLYLKKPNPVTSTSDAAISIDISSDEDDDESKEPEPTGSKTGPPTKPPQMSSIPTDSTLQPPSTSKVTNGTKPFDLLLENTIETNTRPGPASQKKRKLEPLSSSSSNGTQEHLATHHSASSKQPSQGKPKKFKKEVYATRSNVTFADVGGADNVLKELCELILHIKHPEMYRHIGLPPPRGILLSGPPGSGKTLLAHAIAGQLDVLLVEVPATELIAGVSGESEERIREIFEQASVFAPCVLFIDEIDAISSNRQNAQKDMERRIVSQLLSSLDNMSKFKYGDEVLVIGATNRADVLDPALRRVGRFDHEISLGIPDRTARSQILNIISRNLKIDENFDYDEIASLTPGYVAADLLALTTRAALTAIKRVIRTKEAAALIASESVEVKEPEAEIETKQEEMVAETSEQPPAAVVEQAEPKPEGEPEEQKMDVDETVKISDELVEAAPAVGSNDEITQNIADDVKVTMEVEPIEEVVKEVETVENVPIIPPLKDMNLEDMLKWLQTDSTLIEPDELRKMSITRDDFVEAIKHTQPSAKREGFITVPDVTW